jgi:hypothetical protein
MWATNRRGFAVNLIAPKRPEDAQETDLYYIAPESWISCCEQELQCCVEVLTDYSMREFTAGASLQ